MPINVCHNLDCPAHGPMLRRIRRLVLAVADLRAHKADLERAHREHGHDERAMWPGSRPHHALPRHLPEVPTPQPLDESESTDMSDENDTTESHLLTRAKMLPVDDVIYCLFHTAVHEDTTDPYNSGQPECEKSEHRPVYYRARKGDIDETIEVEMHGEPKVGESHGVTELADGSLMVDSLTDVQERVKTRVIAAAHGGELTENERGIVLGLIRSAIKKVARNREGARRLFGAEYDPTQHDQRLALLENAKGKLED